MPVCDQLKMVKLTAKRVREKITNLRTEDAARPDGIGPMLLKEVSAGLTPEPMTIFKKSMESGQVPADWKECNPNLHGVRKAAQETIDQSI
jgi:hypothetical protein